MIPIKDTIPTDRFPLVTTALILANVIVYILAIRHGGSLFSGPDAHEVLKYGAIPRALTHSGGHWHTALTSMFLHASIVQLAVNMLFLWIFGNSVEDAMGGVKFIGFYLLGGLVALTLLVALSPNSAAPTVGATGAIAAVIGGYIVLFHRGPPRGRVYWFVLIPFFFTVIEMPALVMVGIWFIVQLLFAAAHLTNPLGGGGVAPYFAQVGGFVFGLLTIRLLATRRRPVAPQLPVY